MTQQVKAIASELRETSAVREDPDEYKNLTPRKDADPMRLFPLVLKELDHYFSTRGMTYLLGQRELLSQAAEAVLQAVPSTVTAIPFQPGLGKSTLIRALLKVFSVEFQQNTPIAQTVGGIVVVVEKTAEAEDLEALCNSGETQIVVAKAISAPNDYNLAQGRCLNGSASTYAECPGRRCPDYMDCPLAQSAGQIHDTPILIMLHARYQRYMENMMPFLTWEDDAGTHRRTLLLVDEIPSLFEERILDLTTINQIESEFSRFKPSYHTQYQREKSALLYSWNTSVRTPFFKLLGMIRRYSGAYGMISSKEREKAGFDPEKLQTLKISIITYLGTSDHTAIRLVDALLSTEPAYYAIGQDIALFFPRLRKLSSETQPTTFLFSGTASLSPELSLNPDIRVFSDQNLESFQRLTINIQRGDLFNSSKSGLSKGQNLSAVIAWLKYILPQMIPRHKKILLVTYKSCATVLWNTLTDFQDALMPYVGSDGQPKPMLPYFGGLNGSNLYRECTCVICLGLNRFEPRDYISRTLALDFNGRYRDEINTAMELYEGNIRLDGFPSIMDIQDVTLARDIVQLVFRSALRNHGESQEIDLWLLQPPNGVVRYLQGYFVDCQIQEFTELPESCQLAATAGRTYMGKQTHAGKLLDFLSRLAEGISLTPRQIRETVGLTPEQFKEAKKHRAVQDYFAKHIHTTGSGRNTVYTKDKPELARAI